MFSFMGLKQSPRELNATLHKFMREDRRVARQKSVQSIYIRFSADKSRCTILAVYEDNLVFIRSTEDEVRVFKQKSILKYKN